MNDKAMPAPGPQTLSARERERLHVLFLAKHALSGGAFDVAGDGNHAVYHHEILATLRDKIGLSVTAATDFPALFQPIRANFVFSLLNRAGFFNSEVLAAALCERLRVPYMGATPVVRGLTDDKHYSKLLFEAIGIPTPAWQMYYRADSELEPPSFADAPMVVKPNNSSASWGLSLAEDWAAAKESILSLHDQGWDVLVEAYLPGEDVSVPVIGTDPLWVLPPICQKSENADHIITYEQKRGFAEGLSFARYGDDAEIETLRDFSRRISRAVGPYDYGRIDYRLDERDGRFHCLELNVSCNIQSTKAIVKAAEMEGVDQPALIETIVAASLRRQGVTL